MEEVGTQKLDIDELEKKLGYVFNNKALLQQALTRESAIQEKVPGAAERSYQALEFVGDAALKHAIARLLFAKPQGVLSEAELHDKAKSLIGNEGILPEIANKIGLAKFMIKGKGEDVVTPKMKADMLEAILGAVSMDSKSQEKLFSVVKQHWGPHIKSSLKKILKAKKVKVAVQPNTNNLVPPLNDAPSSPRTLKIFSTLSGLTSLEEFEAVVSEASNVNGRNIGKSGDTPLMTLLARKKFREGKEVPRVAILLKYGALWTAPNHLGKTADDVVASNKNIDPSVIVRLKSSTPLKK